MFPTSQFQFKTVTIQELGKARMRFFPPLSEVSQMIE